MDILKNNLSSVEEMKIKITVWYTVLVEKYIKQFGKYKM